MQICIYVIKEGNFYSNVRAANLSKFKCFYDTCLMQLSLFENLISYPLDVQVVALIVVCDFSFTYVLKGGKL